MIRISLQNELSTFKLILFSPSINSYSSPKRRDKGGAPLLFNGITVKAVAWHIRSKTATDFMACAMSKYSSDELV